VQSAAESGERQHHNITLAILTVAGIAFALQQTMVIPALPALQRDLHTTTAWVTWLLTGFLLTASVATPLVGKLGDQYGKERLLVISLGVFFLGCVGAALAPNIAVLIGFRMIQGVGGAVFPLSFSIIKDEFPAEKVGIAVGVVSSVFAVGGGLGLVLSGLIVDHLSWRCCPPASSACCWRSPRASAGAGARGGSPACSRVRSSRSSPGCSSSSACPSRWSTCACSSAARSCSPT
jgi:MFS family permease